MPRDSNYVPICGHSKQHRCGSSRITVATKMRVALIVYDSELEILGLETQVQGGPSYLLGAYVTIDDSSGVVGAAVSVHGMRFGRTDADAVRRIVAYSLGSDVTNVSMVDTSTGNSF